MYIEKHLYMSGMLKIKLNLKMLANGKELGITQRITKVCMMLFRGKVKQLEIAQEF